MFLFFLSYKEIKHEISSLNFIFLYLLIPRIGIVFIGNSEETMEIKILGKLER